MDAKRTAVGDLFAVPSQLETPRFQRPYVWELEKNWTALWEAVQEVADKNMTGGGRTRFLGAVVIKETTGRGITAVKVWELIDGQQRVTSLQLLLAAVRDILKEAAARASRRGAPRRARTSTSYA